MAAEHVNDVNKPVDFVAELKKIREAREAATNARQKFQALADKEVDKDRKDFYEAVAAIHFNIDSIWAEIHMLYYMGGQSQLRLNILHDAILELAGDNMNLVLKIAEKDKEVNEMLDRLLKES
jgi:hypothetical protein